MSKALPKLSDETPDALRKRKLIADGEFFRVGILHAKTNVGYALRPEAILRGVAEHAAGFAGARVDHFMSSPIAGVRMAMPYLLTVFSFIGRKKLVKPALVVGALVAGAAVWLVRRKHAAEHDPAEF